MIVIGTKDAAGLGSGKIDFYELVAIMDKDPNPVALLQPFFYERMCEAVHPFVERSKIKGNLFRHERCFRGELIGISRQHFSYGHRSPPHPLLHHRLWPLSQT